MKSSQQSLISPMMPNWFCSGTHKPLAPRPSKATIEASTKIARQTPRTISGYIKGSRIEGDTIIIELDSDFINNLLSSSLAGSGLESAEALVDKLEMRAKVGNGSLEESIDMDFDMSYMGASMSADMNILYTMKKK